MWLGTSRCRSLLLVGDNAKSGPTQHLKPSWITRRSVHDLNDAVTCTLRRTGGDHQSAEHRQRQGPASQRSPGVHSPGHVVRSWSEIAGGQAQSIKQCSAASTSSSPESRERRAKESFPFSRFATRHHHHPDRLVVGAPSLSVTCALVRSAHPVGRLHPWPPSFSSHMGGLCFRAAKASRKIRNAPQR
jgi:hypothetical protein